MYIKPLPLYFLCNICAAAALRCQHLATVHCIQGDSTTAASLLQKASDIIETIQDKRLRLFNVFLSGANSALQGKLDDAICTLHVHPQMIGNSNGHNNKKYILFVCEIGVYKSSKDTRHG